uniref:Very-long-chain 3-oxoacyl-CoA synthase n=1 Tax=Panagrolaimus sp. JU765 TaxID=591449 RepID=A0AC34Q4D3_9BILA
MVEQRNNLLSTQCFIKLGFIIVKNKFISDDNDPSIFDSDNHLEKSEIYRDKFTFEFERRQKLLKYDPILAFIFWFFSTIAIAIIKMPPLKELKFNFKNLINFYTVLFLFNTFLIGIIAFSQVFFNDCYYGI